MMHNQKIAADKQSNILITQGEYAISDKPDAIISTLLGSCVACCLWDPEAQVGGMNHLLLAGERVGASSGYDIAGVAEMEWLINGIIKLGGRRDKLQSKVFGGAQMFESSSGIGGANAQFAFDYLKQENIPCQNSSVGGKSARGLRFWATSGRVSLRIVNQSVELPPAKVEVQPAGNDMELF
ncbi:MAG: chemotaxis protein CheD [Aliishimia sp.]